MPQSEIAQNMQDVILMIDQMQDVQFDVCDSSQNEIQCQIRPVDDIEEEEVPPDIAAAKTDRASDNNESGNAEFEDSSEPSSQKVNFDNDGILEDDEILDDQKIVVNMPKAKSRMRPKRKSSATRANGMIVSDGSSARSSYHGLSRSQSELGYYDINSEVSH